ncbi:MAG: ABC transporter permease [Planctomycetes bacterium]|nr:ABC transporter permease [Planctomycetota bacterium]
MSKTFLVAQREYLENVRTKTFWIGILAVPVILILSFVGVALFSKAKGVRTYAVLDRSAEQWLSKAIEQRAQGGDLQRILRESRVAREQAAQRTPAQIRAELEEARAGASAPPLRELLEILLAMPDQDLARFAAGTPDPQLILGHPQLMAWATRQDPKQMAALASGLDAAKYRRVEVREPGTDAEARLRAMVQSGELFAYFVIGPDPIQGTQECLYVSNNFTDRELREWFSGLATEIVRERRVASLKLTAEQGRFLQERFVFSEKQVSEKTGALEEVQKTQKAFQFAPLVFVYLLFISVLMWASMLLTNTIEEKSNRILEVLLSSVSPFQLMAGKVLGIAGTGLTVVVSWVAFAYVGVKALPLFLERMPDVEFTAILGSPLYLASFAGYFLAGYLFYAAILVGIGSVCNSLKEAQNLVMPVNLLLMVPLLAMLPVVNEPNGTLARVLTYIPLFTPFLMMNRAGGPPPMWEYGASTVLIALSVAVAFWAAAKVFRIGVLMTGKPPRLTEILHWIRAPVGTPHVHHEET